MNNDERVKHPELFAEVLYGWSIFNLAAAAATPPQTPYAESMQARMEEMMNNLKVNQLFISNPKSAESNFYFHGLRFELNQLYLWGKCIQICIMFLVDHSPQSQKSMCSGRYLH